MTLRLVKRPTVSLRGRVLGPGGRPVAGARVRISFRTGNEQNAYGDGKEEEIRTGPDGTFRTPDGVPRSDQYRASRHRPGDGAGRLGLGEGAGRRPARRDPAPDVAAAVGRRPGGRRRRSGGGRGRGLPVRRRAEADERHDRRRGPVHDPRGLRRAGLRLRQEGRVSLRGPSDRGGRRAGHGRRLEGRRPRAGPVEARPAALVEGRGAGEGPRAGRAASGRTSSRASSSRRGRTRRPRPWRWSTRPGWSR